MGFFLFQFRYLRLLDVHNRPYCFVQRKTIYRRDQRRCICVFSVPDYDGISISATFLYGKPYAICNRRRNDGGKYRRLAVVQYCPGYYLRGAGMSPVGRTKGYHAWKAALVCATCLFGDRNKLFILFRFRSSDKTIFCCYRYCLYRRLLPNHKKIAYEA